MSFRLITRKEYFRRRAMTETLCLLAEFLPVHKRILFHLYYREGYTAVEIAQLLMIHPTSVSRRVNKIRKELLAEWEKREVG